MDEHTPFKSPNRLDCLKWAVTEVAEAIDADMHGYVRNNDHERSVEMELGDTILDLLTMFPVGHKFQGGEYTYWCKPERPTLLQINSDVAVVAAHEEEAPEYRYTNIEVEQVLYKIMVYLGSPKQFDKALGMSMTKIHSKWMVAS
jgi:hypothetical protein